MGFTTPIFLFAFFPLCAAALALDRLLVRWSLWRRARLGDWTALGISLGFYAWALAWGALWLCGFVCLVWLAGRLMLAARDWRLMLPLRKGEEGPLCSLPLKTALFALAAAGAVACLARYKYWAFGLELWNRLTGGAAGAPGLTVPLGLSFLVFSAISYLADVYRGDAPAESLLDCGLFLAFFPKVVSGPIVLWRDFQPQIAGRRAGTDDLCAGAERMCAGFAKKVLLADMFGACVAEIDRAAALSGVDAPTAWLAVLLYMLQIYYDFAGYSDIAIGLGRFFGFRFREIGRAHV